MATTNKRFVAKNGLDNNNQTITNIGAAGTSLGLSGTGDLTIAISGTATLTLPAGSDTLVTLTGTQTLINKTLTSPVISSITNTGTLTLPTSTDTLVGRATTDTLTNKTISGANNTLSNIGNASLSNSTISGIALGSNLADLTMGTGVSLNSGTTYNGGTAKTISIGQAVATTDNVTFAGVTADNVRVGVTAAGEIDTSTGNLTLDSTGGTTVMDDDVNVTGNLQVDGNLTVSGTTVTVNATNLAVEDNMIYLNNGSAVANPDLGFAGNYNDGTYRHAGVFRDATDGVFKFFHQYVPEPDASAYIDTTHGTFALAPVQASSFTGTLVGAAPAGSLSGSTLASGVTASSLTSVGTLTGLTVSGASPSFNTVDSTGTLTLGSSAAIAREQRFRATNDTASVDFLLNGASTSWGLYDRTATKWAIQVTRGATDAVSIPGSLAVTNALSTSSTLQASSYAAVGGAVSANAQLYVRGTMVGSGTNQYGALVQTTFPVAATSSMQGVYVQSTGAAGTYTTSDVVGVNIQPHTLGSVQTVNNAYGVFIATSSFATTNSKYGISIGSVTGGASNNFALYTNTGQVRLGDDLRIVSGSLSLTTIPSKTAVAIQVNTDHALLTSATSYGMLMQPTAQGTVTNYRAIEARVVISATTALTNAFGAFIRTPTITAGGTISTNYGLHIEGQTGATTNYAIYTNAGLVRFGDVVLGANGTVSAPAYSNNADTNTGTFFPAADTLAFATGGSEWMRLDASGNVGIGTTSPASKLHVEGGVISARPGATNVQSITLFDSNYGLGMDGSDIVIFANASQGISFKAGSSGYNGSSLMRILGSGNVGIGTSSPAERLSVYTNADSRNKIRIQNDSSGSSARAELVVNAWGNSWGVGMGSTANNSNAFYIREDSNGADTPRLTILTGGNVGIGTTSPATALHLLGTLTVGNSTYSRPALTPTNWGYSASYRVMMVGSSSTSYSTQNTGAVTVAFNYDPSGNANGSFNGDGREILFRRGTQFVTPNSADTSFNLYNLVLLDGNVGIGTSPQARLHVQGGDIIRTNTDYVASSAGSGFVITPGASSGNTYTQIYAFSNGNTAYNNLVIPGGNVGIGTTSPAGPLHVKASGNYGSIISDNSTNTGGGGFVVRKNGSTIGGVTNKGAWYGDTTNDLSIFAETGYNVRIYTDGSITEKFIVTTSGNVGIGTTSPGAYKLYVSGDQYISGTLTEASSMALKENIHPITDALSIIKNITGYTYDRKDGTATNQSGFIAEEVAEVLPGVVSVDEQGNPSGVQYTKIIAYLVESIKELKAELDELKRQ